MLAEDKINSWNELCVNNKIQKSDLCEPTETFLTKTFIHYLRMFGYKLEEPGYGEANERRLFSIKLARKIDEILKISNKSYAFTYYDLINPTPNRTSRVLEILLNYLYFYNMYKTKAFEIANECIKTRQDLQMELTHSQKIIENIGILTNKIAIENSNLAKLSANKKKQEKQLNILEASVKEMETKLENLTLQKCKMEKEIVPNEEVCKLKKELFDLQKSIKNIEQLMNSKQANMKECDDAVKHTQNVLKIIKSVKEVMPRRILLDINEIRKSKKKITEDVERLERDKQDHLDLICKLEKESETLCLQLQNKKSEHDQEKNKRLITIETKRRLLNENISQLKIMEQKNKALDNDLKEQEDIRNFLQLSLGELFGSL